MSEIPAPAPHDRGRMRPVRHVVSVVGARPNFMKTAPGDRGARPATGPGPSTRSSTRASTTTTRCRGSSSSELGVGEPGPHARRRLGVARGADRAGDGAPRAGPRARAARRRARPGRRELDGRGGARRGQARHPGRPHRGRACARSTARCPRRSTGSSPTSSRACCSSTRPRRATTCCARACAERPHPRRRQHDDRHARRDAPAHPRLDAAAAHGLAARRVPRRDAAPPRARRRPAARRPRWPRWTASPREMPGRLPDPPAHGERDGAPGRWRSRAPGVRLIEPLGYLEFLSLLESAAGVLTDSGGIQEETTYLGIPCFTLRDNTERPVTCDLGTNVLLGLAPERIVEVPGLIAAARDRPATGPAGLGRRGRASASSTCSRRACRSGSRRPARRSVPPPGRRRHGALRRGRRPAPVTPRRARSPRPPRRSPSTRRTRAGGARTPTTGCGGRGRGALVAGRRRRQVVVQLHARAPVDVRRLYRRPPARIAKTLGAVRQRRAADRRASPATRAARRSPSTRSTRSTATRAPGRGRGAIRSTCRRGGASTPRAPRTSS